MKSLLTSLLAFAVATAPLDLAAATKSKNHAAAQPDPARVADQRRRHAFA